MSGVDDVFFPKRAKRSVVLTKTTRSFAWQVRAVESPCRACTAKILIGFFLPFKHDSKTNAGKSGPRHEGATATGTAY